MNHTRQIKITAIRHRLLRLRSSAVSAHCAVCGREVETLAAAQAAEVLEVETDRLNLFIADGRVHAIGTVSGSLRICKDSLFPRQ
jgi:predicted site-specific integrase-resolvase